MYVIMQLGSIRSRHTRNEVDTMATDRLTHIIEERKEQFSNEDLEAAHKRIEEILSTRKWDAIWKKPEAIALARKLAEESREDELEEGGFDCL
jgi:hypothetical protein